MNVKSVGIEESIRNSGLNYMIATPLGLDIYSDNLSMYSISQNSNDRKSPELNKISANTFGKLLSDSIMDRFFPDKCSFDCFSTTNQLTKVYNYTEGKIIIKAEEKLIERKSIKHYLFSKFVLFSTISFAIGSCVSIVIGVRSLLDSSKFSEVIAVLRKA